MDKKRIPIGFEDFRKFQEENLYLVDKTLLIIRHDWNNGERGDAY